MIIDRSTFKMISDAFSLVCDEDNEHMLALRKQAKEYPSNPDYLFKFAMGLEENQQLEQAKSIMVGVLLMNDEPQYHRGYAKILRKLNKPEDAKVEIEKAITKQPRKGENMLEMAMIMEAMNSPEEAEKCYEKAIELKPEDPMFLNSFGVHLANKGETSKAEKHFDEAIRINPNEAEYYFNKGENCERMENINLAQEMYNKAMTLSPEEPLYYSSYANILAKKQENQKADEVFQQAIKVKPNSIIALNNYGLFLNKLGKHEESIALFQEALKVDEDDGEVYSNLGHVLFQAKQYKKAHLIYEKAIYRKLEDGALFANYAMLLNHIESFTKAEQYYLKAIQAEPSNDKYYANYGVFLMKLDRFDEAERNFLKSIELNPGNSFSHYNYSQLLNKAKRVEEALHQIEKAIDSDKTENPLFLFSGAVYNQKSNNKKAAKVLFKKAKKVLKEGEGKQRQLGNKFQMPIEVVEEVKKSMETYEDLERRIDHLTKTESIETDDQQLKEIKSQAMDSLQEMLAKEQVTREEKANIQKRMIKFQRRLEDMEERINHIETEITLLKKELMWDETLTRTLAELKDQQKHLSVIYAKNMCWMLATSIQSYRQLKMGIVGKGYIPHKSKIGEYVEKLGRVLGKASCIPIVGQYCGIILAIAGLYLEMEDEAIIEKIITITSTYFSQKLLSKAVTECVLYLIENPSHIQVLEDTSSSMSFMDEIKEKKEKIMDQILESKLTQRQKHAIVDTSVAISHLIQCGPEEQDPLRYAVEKMLAEKLKPKKEINNKLQPYHTVIDDQGGCCKKCQIM